MMLMRMDRQGRCTLPEEVCRALGVGGEDSTVVLLWKTERGTYELGPASLVPADQRWFWHPEMAARVAGAEASFREGRSSRADTPEEAQAFLDGLKQS